MSAKGTALITGASSGIGAIYADRLAKRGYDLVLVARNQARLAEVAARIEKDTGRSVKLLPADLNDSKDVARVEAELKDNTSITMLVNNAGMGAVTPLLQSDIGKMDEIMKLNVHVVTHLTYAVVPGFVARGGGTIINNASIVAIKPELLNGVYGASKAYVMAFTQSLQHELADKGIRVQAVLPCATATEFWDIAGMPHSNMPKEWVMSADDLVDAALAGLDQGEVITIPALPDVGEWSAYEAARVEMGKRLTSSAPAARYGVQNSAAA